MFTGLIEATGVITRAERAGQGMRCEVYAPEFGRDMAIGDSIAVDGACLTVVKFIRGAFLADVSAETLDRTTLGALKQGTKVNLERALRLSDRLGGHLVSGHIDGVGELMMRTPGGNATVYQFRIPGPLMQYIIEKGSVAIDGISLTVMQTKGDLVACAVVPHTEQVTKLAENKVGDAVNVEVDMMAKYVKRYVGGYVGTEGATDDTRRGLGDMLREFGEGR